MPFSSQKSKKLLSVFGGLAALKNASAEQIAAVKGITVNDAKNIYEYFNKE